MAKRENLRIDQQISIVIDYFNKCEKTGEYKPVLLMCEGLDVSAGGFKVRLDKPLPLQAIYHVALKASCVEFSLAVQTRWCEPIAIEGSNQESNEFFMGLQILESDDTDIIAWMQWVAEQLDVDSFY